MGWPENTNPRSVDPPTNPVHGLPYGPVHGPLLRTPPYGPPQKIAEKKRCRKYKQKWQKDLTYHLNGLTARVGVNSNAYFCRINRLRRKVVLIAYCYLFCCGDVWKTTKDPYALKIKNFICVLFCHRHFVGLSLPRSRSRTRPRPHEKQYDFSPLSWQPWMTGKNSWILITFVLVGHPHLFALKTDCKHIYLSFFKRNVEVCEILDSDEVSWILS